MRYRFLSYVDQPGTPFLGIATLRGDPVTGELLVGDANVGGPALDLYRTTALQTVDLVTGNITDARFTQGEDVRQYLENLGNVELPARPRVDFSVAAAAGKRQSKRRDEVVADSRRVSVSPAAVDEGAAQARFASG